MLFHVHMQVHIPESADAETVRGLIQEEKKYAQTLQRQGKWLSIWRIVGEYANFSIFDVEDNEELHSLLTSLPLYSYLTLKVTPLTTHPSAI